MLRLPFSGMSVGEVCLTGLHRRCGMLGSCTAHHLCEEVLWRQRFPCPTGDVESSHAAALAGRAPAPQVHPMPPLLRALMWGPTEIRG